MCAICTVMKRTRKIEIEISAMMLGSIHWQDHGELSFI